MSMADMNLTACTHYRRT